MITATIYGDSVLKFIVYENGKYVINREHEQALCRRFDIQLRNLSRFGATLGSTLEGIQRDLAANPTPQYCVLEFGGNDCDYPWAEISQNPFDDHTCATPPDKFRTLYKKAIALVREAGSQPILTTLPPIMPDRYLTHICQPGLSRENILRWAGDVNVIYRWHEKYSLDIMRIAQEEGVDLIDLRAPFLSRRHLGGLICDDGIHPNRAGQKLIADAFAAFISAKQKQANN